MIKKSQNLDVSFPLRIKEEERNKNLKNTTKDSLILFHIQVCSEGQPMLVWPITILVFRSGFFDSHNSKESNPVRAK